MCYYDNEDDPCRHGGHYDVATHIVYYCDQCHLWFHETCLDIVGPLDKLRTTPSVTLPPHLTAHTRVDHLWASLLAIPICRKYANIHNGMFCTFESVLLAARSLREQRPANVGDWVRDTLTQIAASKQIPPASIADAAVYIKMLCDIPPRKRLVYKCRAGHLL